MADALRDELANELKRAYGDLQSAAEALGIPYKTLYRALTIKGQDRSQTVKLDLVIQIAEHLEGIGRRGFPELYEVAASNFSHNPEETDADFDGA